MGNASEEERERQLGISKEILGDDAPEKMNEKFEKMSDDRKEEVRKMIEGRWQEFRRDAYGVDPMTPYAYAEKRLLFLCGIACGVSVLCELADAERKDEVVARDTQYLYEVLDEETKPQSELLVKKGGSNE